MLAQDICQGLEHWIATITARHVDQVIGQIDPQLIVPLFIHLASPWANTLSQGTLTPESVSIEVD